MRRGACSPLAESVNCGYCRDCRHWQEEPRLSKIYNEAFMHCVEVDAVFTPNGWDDAYFRCAPDFGCVKWEQRAES